MLCANHEGMWGSRLLAPLILSAGARVR